MEDTIKNSGCGFDPDKGGEEIKVYTPCKVNFDYSKLPVFIPNKGAPVYQCLIDAKTPRFYE
jgi:hypothetical protein